MSEIMMFKCNKVERDMVVDRRYRSTGQLHSRTNALLLSIWEQNQNKNKKVTETK